MPEVIQQVQKRMLISLSQIAKILHAIGHHDILRRI